MEGIIKDNGLWYLATNQATRDNSASIQMCYQTHNDLNSLKNVYQEKRIKEAMQFLHA